MNCTWWYRFTVRFEDCKRQNHAYSECDALEIPELTRVMLSHPSKTYSFATMMLKVRCLVKIQGEAFVLWLIVYFSSCDLLDSFIKIPNQRTDYRSSRLKTSR